MEIICICDCRIDDGLENNFLILNLGGELVFEHVLDEIISCDCFLKKYLLTNSSLIEQMVEDKPVEIIADPSEAWSPACCCMISGSAAFLSKKTIEEAVRRYQDGILFSARKAYTYKLNPSENCSFIYGIGSQLVNAFAVYRNDAYREYSLDDYQRYEIGRTEGLVINSKDDFELALVLKKKENNREILKENIKARIEEKKQVLEKAIGGSSICLVGHSQIDNWECEELMGFPVRNCGIRGISSFEYRAYILEKNLLNCDANIFICMHGTNDIVYDYSDEEIIDSIEQIAEYIRCRNRKSLIYVCSIAHVNGRMDRSNKRITRLNGKMKRVFEGAYGWISLDELDDEFGNLRLDYTTDGLHISEDGYRRLREIVEQQLR